jgi:hypothetical protein
LRQNNLFTKSQRDHALFLSLEWTLVRSSTSPANTAIMTTSFLHLGFSSLCVAGRGMYDHSHAAERVGLEPNPTTGWFQACLWLVPGMSQASQRLLRLVPTWFQTGPRLVSGWSQAGVWLLQAGPMLSGWFLRAPAWPRLLPDISLAGTQAGPRLIRLVLVCSQADPTCLKLLPG